MTVTTIKEVIQRLEELISQNQETGNRLGYFTAGLAMLSLPVVRRLLRMTVIGLRLRLLLVGDIAALLGGRVLRVERLWLRVLRGVLIGIGIVRRRRPAELGLLLDIEGMAPLRHTLLRVLWVLRRLRRGMALLWCLPPVAGIPVRPRHCLSFYVMLPASIWSLNSRPRQTRPCVPRSRFNVSTQPPPRLA